MASKSTSLHVSCHHKSNIHLKWNNKFTPVLVVDSGTKVSFELLDGCYNMITEKSTITDVENMDLAFADPAHGPVFVNGAEPGDVLKIEFLELETADYGWTAIFPGKLGFGLLAADFPTPYLKIWDLKTHRSENYAEFPGRPGIHIPLKPFLGVVGIAREEPGDWATIPPYETGGNIDTKYITAGSTLWLPIKVKGALFSCGDGHAAQGDGEVCGTAIETPMKATVKLTIEKNKTWVNSPHYLTSGIGPGEDAKVKGTGEYAAVGVAPDLLEASRKALSGLIEWVVATKGLEREEAYVLASVAADLKITEIVDMPNFAVACVLPLSVFVGEEYQ